MRILPSLARSSCDADCCGGAPGAANCMLVVHWPQAGGKGLGGDGSTATTGYHAPVARGHALRPRYSSASVSKLRHKYQLATVR